MFLVLIVLAIVNTYKWIVCGEQNIKISTSSKAYTSSELYLSVIAQENGVDLETKTKIKLLDSKGKKVSSTTINLYLRNFDVSQIVNLDIKFRASYPVQITGLAIRAYLNSRILQSIEKLCKMWYTKYVLKLHKGGRASN